MCVPDLVVPCLFMCIRGARCVLGCEVSRRACGQTLKSLGVCGHFSGDKDIIFSLTCWAAKLGMIWGHIHSPRCQSVTSPALDSELTATQNKKTSTWQQLIAKM